MLDTWLLRNCPPGIKVCLYPISGSRLIPLPSWEHARYKGGNLFINDPENS